MKLDEAIGRSPPKILVYGAAGTGKTTFAASLPGKKLIASAEKGLLSLRGSSSIDVVEIETIEDLDDVVSLVAGGDHDYSWLVVDSLTEIAELILSTEKEAAPDPRQAYGELQDQMGVAMRRLRGLQIGVYVTAHEARVDDTVVVGRVLFRPSMPGKKLAEAVPHVFDSIFRLVVEGDLRSLITRADGKTSAKDRSGKLMPREDAGEGLGVVVEKMLSE
jgi:phage nucleotide-binding protein